MDQALSPQAASSGSFPLEHLAGPRGWTPHSGANQRLSALGPGD